MKTSSNGKSNIARRLERLLPNAPAAQAVPPPTPPPGPPPLPSVETLGISGTPIVGGFLQDLGEYNGELAGRNAIPIYEQMRRGDAQVKATLEACKLPVLSAHWTVVPADVTRDSANCRDSEFEVRDSANGRESEFGVRDSGRKSSSKDSSFPNPESRTPSPGFSNPEPRTPKPVSNTGAGRATAAKAREVASFVEANLFGGLEFRTSTGGWATQNWNDVVRNALLMLDFGCAAHEDVWRVDGDRIRLRRLAARLPLTFYRWHTEADGETLLALEQYGYRGSRFVSVLLPADKCTVFTREREGANFWGLALALDLDMTIPGPDGWKTMREIQPGDRVFDDEGRIRHVVRKTEVFKSRPCYRVTFSSGTSIIADRDHLWLTRTAKERDQDEAGQVRRTEEIFLSQRAGTRTNHSIETSAPVQYAPQWGLPIHPYLLGLWLGDGDSRTGSISCHADEAREKLSILQSIGYSTRWRRHKTKPNAGDIFTSALSQKKLKVLGLYRNKHVPAAYLRGDVAQRRALLAGLMDSDGTCNEQGQCSFSNSNRLLIASVRELLRSLGEVPRLVENRKARNPGVWEVRFTTKTNPFWASKKAQRIRRETRWTRARHYILKVEPTEPRDVACIEVDNPSHLFLAGEGFIPTHNCRSMYPHWYVKNRLYRLDAIACERNSLGIPVYKLPPGFSQQDRETAYSFVTQLAAHEATGLVEPPGDATTGLRIVGYEGRVRDTAPSIEHHNVMISRAALALFMDLGQAQHGSRALGVQANDFFMLALQNVADQIALEITNTSVRRLVAYNFGEQAPLPRLVAANVQARSFDNTVAALTQFAQTGLVVSEANLRGFIRKELSLPPEGASGVAAVRGEVIAEGPDAGDVVGKGSGFEG